VHRDLKPANIHLEQRAAERDYVKVLDFGIAKLRDGQPVEDVTSVGQMVGTFDYMAPEQMAGTCIPQSDVFTLGVVIYEMISGVRPFGVTNGPAAMLAALLGTTPALLANVPPQLAQIVAKCLDRDPEARFATAGELGAALATLGERLEHEGPTVPSPRGSHVDLEGATLVDRPHSAVARTTLPGMTSPVVPTVPRPSVASMPIAPTVPRLASGTADPYPGTFYPPNIPITPINAAMQIRHPSPMIVDLRPRRMWPVIAFIVLAIAIGIAIGIGFAT
jgi:serine/threonine protein kinase